MIGGGYPDVVTRQIDFYDKLDRVLGGMPLSGLLEKKTNYTVSGKTVKSALGPYNDYKNQRTTDDYNVEDKVLKTAKVMSTESYRLSGNDISSSVVERLKDLKKRISEIPDNLLFESLWQCQCKLHLE